MATRVYWYVSGGSSRHSTVIEDEDLADCGSEIDRDFRIHELIHEDFVKNISPEIDRIERI